VSAIADESPKSTFQFALPNIYIPNTSVLSVVDAAIHGETLIAKSHLPEPVETPDCSTSPPPFLLVAPDVAEPALIVRALPAVSLVVCRSRPIVFATCPENAISKEGEAVQIPNLFW
jgi:hypothetical protein